MKDLKRSLEKLGYKHDVPEFIKKGGFMREESGKKEMIVKLESIQEESMHCNEVNNRISKHQSGENALMEEWNAELSQLEMKFKKFEEKVERIKKKNN